MCLYHLVDRLGVEGKPPGAEVVIRHGQRILIGPARDAPFEHLGRHVVRREPEGAISDGRLDYLRQPEIGQARRSTNQEDVLRLDVTVLDSDESAITGRVAELIEEVNRPSQLVHVAEQLVARQAGKASVTTGTEAVP